MITGQPSKDLTIQNTLIPKGTALLTLPATTHHNPTIWGEDCDEFNPDRWDRLEGEAATASSFMAFSQGPRVYIGKVVTVIQVKVVLVEMVKGYEFELVEEEMKFLIPSPILRVKGGWGLG